ncbi:MAG: hypothetical protein Q4A78_10825 [Peptostreptococcaceae bacterium]|nr:hypothetical protein [Peptostreptococcaceae bacterium]
MKKKLAVVFLSLMFLWTGCGSNPPESVQESGEMEKPDALSGATISQEASEEEVLTYLKDILSEADKLMAVLTDGGLKFDEEDRIEIERTDQQGPYTEEYVRVVSEEFRSLDDLRDFGKKLFTEKAYGENFRFMISEDDLGTAYYIERDGKLYGLSTAPYGYFFHWDLSQGIEIAYAAKDRIIVYATANEMQGAHYQGKIVLAREEDRWKLDSDVAAFYGLPFEFVQYTETADEPLLDSVEAADEAARTFLQGMIEFDEYYRDYDPEIQECYDLEGQTFHALLLSLYEKKEEPVLTHKIFLPVRRDSYKPWIQLEDERGILHKDYGVTGANKDPEAWFGYSINEIPGNITWYELVEDYRTLLSLTNCHFRGNMEKSRKLLFIVPRYYGTVVSWYDKKGEFLGEDEDCFLALGLDDSIGKIVIRRGDEKVEIPGEIHEGAEIEGGFATPYIYPSATIDQVETE